MKANEVFDNHFDEIGLKSDEIIEILFGFIDDGDLGENFKDYLKKNHPVLIEEEDEKFDEEETEKEEDEFSDGFEEFNGEENNEED